MSYFLSNQKLEIGKTFSVEAEEARHMLLSRRMKVGEKVEIQGSDGKRYEVEIVEVKKDLLKAKALKEITVPQELAIRITLFQAVVSEKALDFIFQKATELGAAGITLFNSEHTATKLTADQFKRKKERWQKILWEAAKQCGRGKIPELKFVPGISEVLSEASSFEQVIVLDASGQNLKSQILNSKSASAIALAIGPEGGFTKEELSKLKSIPKSQTISISPFTLRAETAAIAGLSIIQSQI